MSHYGQSLHYGVEMGQVAQVFFVIEMGEIHIEKTIFIFVLGLKCHLVGIYTHGKNHICFVYSWDQ